MTRTKIAILTALVATTHLSVSQVQWTIPITVSDGTNTQVLNFGINPGGTDGFDAGLDVLAPPSPPAGAFDARWRVPSPLDDYLTDIRSDSQVEKTFHMRYAAATGEGPIVLTWDNVGLDDLAETFFLYDDFGGGGFSLDMKTTNTFTTDPSGITASQLALVITPQYLPVQLSSFTGKVLDVNTVFLEWTTLSEVNNYGFEIQKREEGVATYASLPGVFIPGHGTTNESRYYSHTDTTASPGIWYYRLKQVDLDGAVHYSDGIRVEMVTGVGENERSTEFWLSQNYPNPWNPSTTIRYEVPHTSGVMLELFTMLGKHVRTLVDEEQQMGFHEVVLDGRGLPSGTYFYRLRTGGLVSTKRCLLLK